VCYQQTSLFNGFYFVAPSSFCLRLVPPTKARTHVSQPADNDRHVIHRLDTLSTPGRHPFFPPATPLKIRQPMIGRGKFNASPRRKNTQHPRTPHPGPAVERWKRLPGLSGRNNPVHERRTPTNHPERRLALVDRRLGTVRYGAGLASRIPEASERHRRVKSSKKKENPVPHHMRGRPCVGSSVAATRGYVADRAARHDHRFQAATPPTCWAAQGRFLALLSPPAVA
jgi:hypothetical protein